MELEYLPNAALLVDDQGFIQAKGTPTALKKMQPQASLEDYSNKLLLPGFIDTHRCRDRWSTR
jgi:cytosine/adenosine deaminase-related metal-dependent hydrolase